MKSQKVCEYQDEGFLVDFPRAQQAAKILCEHPDIKAVLAFGSVARENEGQDLDVIIICEEAMAEEFISDVSSALCGYQEPYASSAKEKRRNIALSLLSGRGMYAQGIMSILYKMERFVDIYNMDIFMFPPDWRKRLDELQGALPHSDSHFMRNIARDARALWVKP